MRYGQIRQYDIANGPGIRATVFVTGCSRRCVNCFNEEYQDFNAGSEWTTAETERLISYLQDDTNSGLTLLGGEPMENAEDLLELVQAVRRAVPEKSIWVYSGFLYEEILAQPACKSPAGGLRRPRRRPFVDALKDPGLYFRGSSNQLIIDVAKSREAGKAVLLWPDRR